MTPVQRVQYIVAKHDITAIGENVELHGGGSEKWVAQIRQVSPFDGASEPPATSVERFDQRPLTANPAHNARPKNPPSRRPSATCRPARDCPATDARPRAQDGFP